MIYLTALTEAPLLEADARISLNCGFPNNGTTRWAVPRQSNQGVWFIEKPIGYNQFTQAQMMEGVNLTGITEINCQLSDFISGA